MVILFMVLKLYLNFKNILLFVIGTINIITSVVFRFDKYTLSKKRKKMTYKHLCNSKFSLDFFYDTDQNILRNRDGF